jgi:hypothetical protein
MTDHDLRHLVAGLCRAVTNGSMQTTRAFSRGFGLGAEPALAKTLDYQGVIVHGQVSGSAFASGQREPPSQVMGNSAITEIVSVIWKGATTVCC